MTDFSPTSTPSDVSSPLVVMATSSSITVTGGLSSPAGGPQTTIFNVQALQMTLQTVVTVPIGVQSPVVVSEGTHFLHLEWLPPAQPNGVITLYYLYVGGVLSFSGLNTSGHSVYSGANLQATVTGLSPATLYFFSVTTIKSSPDGVPFPNVTIINATALAIVWSTPLMPNGIVTGYVVLETNIPSGFSYVSTDLQPFTVYSCSILACTHEEDSPPGGPPDPESDTDDIVISIFINKIINPDKSFGSSVNTPFNMPRPYTVIPGHSSPGPHVHPSTTLLSASGAYCPKHS
ncbi:hypothetical protein EMCRGX_G027035 [Ephydatia muelleri]